MSNIRKALHPLFQEQHKIQHHIISATLISLLYANMYIGASSLLYAMTGSLDAAGTISKETSLSTTLTWTTVARENSTFTVSGTKLARYGSGTSWVEKVVSGTVECSNKYFGRDPLPGVAKHCDILNKEILVSSGATTPTTSTVSSGSTTSSGIMLVPSKDPNWTTVAKENATFTVNGTKLARYGSGTSWVEKVVSGTVPCTNSYFGRDPLYKVVKHCDVSNKEVLVSSGTTTPTTGTVSSGSTTSGGTTSSGILTTKINGACGTSANKLAYTLPTANLCTIGTASTVTYNFPTYKWNCAGVGSGVTMSCAAAVAPSGKAQSGKDTPSANYIGMGTAGVSDWDGSNAFVDSIKHARFWQDAINWNNKVKGIDEFGWPTADASTVIYTGEPAGINGTHKLIFNGQADVTTMWAPNSSVTNKVYNPNTNTTTADVNFAITTRTSLGLILKNTRRTPTSPLNSGFSNMRLYRPGYPTDGSVIFTTPFLNAMQKVSVVRMMDWAATNVNSLREWTERHTPHGMKKPGLVYVGPGGYTFTGTVGVSLEDQIQLCNTLRSDCWITVPPAASNDYIKKMVLALRYGTDGTNPYTSTQSNPKYPPLNPNSKLYVEYANEIWNSAGGFQGFRIINDIVSNIPADHPLNTPVEANYWYKVWKYPAYRLVTISDTFRSIYGNAAMMTQIRPVLMSQQGGQIRVSIQWLDDYAKRQSPSRDVKSYIYGAGGSGYYGPTIATVDHGNGDIYFGSGVIPVGNFKGMGIDSIWSMNYGVKHIAYEGGPSLDYYTQANAQKINADPRMQDMIVKSHDLWSNMGGDLLVYYEITGSAEWQFTPDINTTNTPKLNGLGQLQNQRRAPVTLGATLPGPIIVMDYKEYRARTGSDYNQTCAGLPCLGGNLPGNMIAFPGNTPNAFSGKISVTGVSTRPSVINIVVNGEPKGQITLSGSTSMATSTAVLANIPAGLVVVRLEIVSGGIDLRSINIDKANGTTLPTTPTTDPTPVAINGSCGTSANQTLSTIPTTNLCSTGTASTISNTDVYTWSCVGVNSGTTASCIAKKTTNTTTYPWVTVAKEGSSFTVVGTKLIRYGSGTSWVEKTLSGTIICNNTFFGRDPLSGIYKHCDVYNGTVTPPPAPVAINGSCGTSANQTLSAIPTTNLCTTGTASAVSNTDMYMWSCNGVNSGSTASCMARKTPITTTTPPPLVAGPGVNGPIANAYNPKYSFCSSLFYGGCKFLGLRTIRYGNGTKWFYKDYIDSFPGSSCHPNTFGVPSNQFDSINDHCEVADTFKMGTLITPVTTQHSGHYPTIDLTKIPLGSPGNGNLLISPTKDFGSTGSDIGSFRIPCRFAKMAFNDPIVFPGISGGSHLHTFFGNVDVNANSTAQSLANSGNSTCAGGIANRSSYWVPTLINTRTHEPIIPSSSIWYYKTGYMGIIPADVKKIPEGLRMVVGNMNTTTSQQNIGLSWECSTSYLTRTGVIPTNCPAGNYIQMTVAFPQCWDGVHLDSPDHKSHMAYGLGGTKGCPASHPVALPLLSLNIHYDVTDMEDTKNWRLSSDHDGNPSGLSIHGDFFEGWNPTVAQTFVTNCLNPSKDCHGYLLGDGTTLMD